MAVTYTNRKKRLYYLCQGVTRTGKPRYYFALEPKETPVDEMPSGYTAQESLNGVVSVVRARPSLFSREEVAAVEAALQSHAQARRYRHSIKSKQITIYESSAPDLTELTAELGGAFGRGLIERMENYSQFTPVMRFTLTDNAKRLFTAQRMCFLGSVDDWIGVGYNQPLSSLLARLIPTLGTDSFFELF